MRLNEFGDSLNNDDLPNISLSPLTPEKVLYSWMPYIFLIGSSIVVGMCLSYFSSNFLIIQTSSKLFIFEAVIFGILSLFTKAFTSQMCRTLSIFFFLTTISYYLFGIFIN